MRNWKLFGKIGAIALTALGLALVPGDFNVPGVGTVEAYAADDIKLKEVVLKNASTEFKFTGEDLSEDVFAAVKVMDNQTTSTIVDSSKCDWSVDSKDEIIEAGEYTIRATAKSGSGYTGSVSLEVTVAKADADDIEITFSPEYATYDGDVHKPTVTATLNNIDVTEYINTASTAWSSGTAGDTTFRSAGTYLFIPAGNNFNNYTGNGKAFEIKGASLDNAVVEGYEKKIWINETPETDDIVVKDNGYTLIKDTDYTIVYAA